MAHHPAVQPLTTPNMPPPSIAVPTLTELLLLPLPAAAAEMPAKATPVATPAPQPARVAVEHPCAPSNASSMTVQHIGFM